MFRVGPEDNWQRDRYLYLHDTKIRKPERVWIDSKSMEISNEITRSLNLQKRTNGLLVPRSYFHEERTLHKAATYSSYRNESIGSYE